MHGFRMDQGFRWAHGFPWDYGFRWWSTGGVNVRLKLVHLPRTCVSQCAVGLTVLFDYLHFDFHLHREHSFKIYRTNT